MKKLGKLIGRSTNPEHVDQAATDAARRATGSHRTDGSKMTRASYGDARAKNRTKNKAARQARRRNR